MEAYFCFKNIFFVLHNATTEVLSKSAIKNTKSKWLICSEFMEAYLLLPHCCRISGSYHTYTTPQKKIGFSGGSLNSS